MKKFNELEKLIEFETNRIIDDFGEDDEFIGNVTIELTNLFETYNDCTIYVFETDEIEDEEYGLIEFNDIIKHVYMTCRGESVRIIVD